MNIQLNKLKILNFKGIRHFEVEFNSDITNIFGRNKAGKSTLMDACLWLLFGKNSFDTEKFEIKTLDENNNAYERIDHSVEGWFTFDGKKIPIKRVYREKWTKKRGEATDSLTGHTTDYYWDDTPVETEREFKEKIASVINEQLFKMLTNTSYFNSLEWTKRRSALVKLAGDVSNADVITSMNLPVTTELREILESGKSLEDFKKTIAAKKKKLKDELILFPSRIDEANRSMPDEEDYDTLERELQSAIEELDQVEELISNKAKAQESAQKAVLELMNKKQAISRAMAQMEFDEKSKVQDQKHQRVAVIENKKRELRALCDQRDRLRNDHTEATEMISTLENQMAALRDRWAIENDKQIQFNESEFCCPTCKRDFPDDQINEKKAELTANFNKDKSELLAKITNEGQNRSEEVKTLKVKLSNVEAEGADLKEKIAKMESEIKELTTQNDRLSANDESEVLKAINENDEYQKLKTERDELTLKIEQPADQPSDNSSLLQNKKDLQYQIDTIKERITTKGARIKQLQRIEELKSQESKMAQDLADLENSEFTMESFVKAKMTAVENKVNSMFKIAKFKMFERQMNEGEKETCVTLVNGVPYPDLNTASKVQVGIDIIETFSKHYKTKAPVWIDNRESVTDIPDTNLQIINLIVSPEHSKLTVGKKQGEALALFS